MTYLTLSGHLFNVPNGDAKTEEQLEFEATFNPLFNDDDNFST